MQNQRGQYLNFHVKKQTDANYPNVYISTESLTIHKKLTAEIALGEEDKGGKGSFFF